jgi:DNA helicase-2/ATP-dependent DNA helicase PcrA
MLNPGQKQAVEHPGGPTLVLAGAGAGKTSVLTQRVARLCQRGVQPSRILVVTFTNKAAREMKERLAKLLGKEIVKEIWAGTFHSICGRILRQEIQHLNLGYSQQFAIYDPRDQEKSMDRVIRALNLDPKDYKPAQMLQMVGKFKNAGIHPDAVSPGEVEDPFHIRLYRQYQLFLRQNNAMDFDDMLFLTLQLLQEQAEVLQRLQQRFEHILVDEYQDTNAVQFELIKRLGEHWRNVFVVGDVDQSIYSFRHANFRIILRFQQDYPDATLIKLEENYRSTGHILAAANQLIQRNNERFEKTLIATRGPGEPIRFYPAQHEDDEASFIIRQIQRLKEQEQLNWGDFAILYRTNSQSRLFEQKLVQARLPYHVVGGFRFYDRREIKDLLGYLQVLANPQDSLSLRRILNVPKRGLGPKALETLETYATFEGRGLTLWQAIQAESVACQLGSRGQEALESFVQMMKALKDLCLPVGELLKRVYVDSGYQAEIEADPDPKQRQNRHENVQALIQAAIEYEESSKDPLNLSGFLESIALFSDSDQLKQEGKAVLLMTVHSAKGLEFPVVFVPGVEENIFPHVRAVMEGPAAIEEERRLMYVAITRARNHLFLIHAATRRNQRATLSNRLSRFMVEIHDHIQIPGNLLVAVRQHEYEQRLKKTNNKTFADLPSVARASLSPGRNELQAGLKPAVPVRPSVTRSGSAAGAMDLHLQSGDQVRHPQWGVGQVQKVIRTLASVSFAGQVRTLDLKVAPLEKISQA